MAAVLAIALLVAGLWWLQEHFSDPAGGGRGSAAADARLAAGQTSAAVTAQAADSQAVSASASSQSLHDTLPPEGSALADQFDALAARARRGDIAAAIRLHRDVNRCRAMRGRPGAGGIDLTQVQAAQTDEARSALEMQLMSCMAQPLCEGVKPEMLRDPTQWVWAAAQAGDQDARTWMASGYYLHDDLEGMAYLAQVRPLALQWLQEGAARGHRPSFDLLGHAYLIPDGANNNPTEALVPQDLVRGLAYQLAGRHRDDPQIMQMLLEGAAAQLTPAELAAAQRLAEELAPTLDHSSRNPGRDMVVRIDGDLQTQRKADARCISPAAHAELLRVNGRDPEGNGG